MKTIFGVTGKSCSGKSSFCRKFTRNGGVYISIDELCHQVLAEKHDEACALLDMPLSSTRKEIGEKVFTDRAKYDTLVRLTWAPVEKLVLSAIDAAEDDVYLDYILLPLAKSIWEKCDIKILVDAPLETRKQRAFERDNLTPAQFSLRESKSIEYDSFEFDYKVFTQ